MLDVVTIGESMIQLTPKQMGLLRHARAFDRYVGGAESNVAIGLVRLGHRAGWVSRVGSDEFGACVRATLRGEGVDTSQVVEDDGAPTGVYFKEQRRADRTRVHYYREGSAASRLSPSDLPREYIAQADYLHLTGITPALSASCREATWTALRIAEEENVAVSFDPNVRRKLWAEEKARTTLREMIPDVHTVLTGRGEASLLTGREDPEAAAQALRDHGASEVVVRLGEAGALAVTEDGVERGDALKVEAVDVVGAGDAFTAGYLSGRLRDWTVGAALRLGNVAGGLATTVRGDSEGIPTWEEVQAYLEEAGGRTDVDR
ncbi:MAG: sugar kinase [Salinibacter sp.]